MFLRQFLKCQVKSGSKNAVKHMLKCLLEPKLIIGFSALMDPVLSDLHFQYCNFGESKLRILRISLKFPAISIFDFC